MSGVELKHAMKVDEDAWFIRFYVWLWKAERSDINFCKLFWGLSLAPFGLLVRLVLTPFLFIARRLDAMHDRRRQQGIADMTQEALERMLAGEPPPERERPTMMKMLDRIAVAFARLAMWSAGAWDFLSRHKRFNKAVGLAFLGLAVLLAVGALVAVVWLAVAYASVTLVVVGVAVAVAVTGLIVLAMWGLGVFSFAGGRIIQPAAKGVRTGGMGLFDVMRTGYVAVKSNTCPRIEFKDDGDA